MARGESLTKDLAESLARAVVERRRIGRVLHDDIGQTLAAAGLRLALLRMDHPDASGRVAEITEVLENAMERVRALSQELCPSPVYRAGFKNALGDLVAGMQARFTGTIRFTFASTVRIPVEAAVAMYEAAEVSLTDAVDHAKATRVSISVSGSKNIGIRIKHNGARRSGRALARAAIVARHSDLTFEVLRERGTIVWIKHALRRPSRG